MKQNCEPGKGCDWFQVMKHRLLADEALVRLNVVTLLIKWQKKC